MKIVHIMCGLPGAGKTTYAKSMSQKSNAVLFSLDEWMANLLGENYSDDEFEKSVLPCQDMIWEASLPLLDQGQDVVYDFAIYSKEGRNQLYKKIMNYGAKAIIYYFDIPYSECKKRLNTRNKSKVVKQPYVSSEQFDLLVEYFAPPTEDEGFEIITIKNT